MAYEIKIVELEQQDTAVVRGHVEHDGIGPSWGRPSAGPWERCAEHPWPVRPSPATT